MIKTFAFIIAIFLATSSFAQETKKTFSEKVWTTTLPSRDLVGEIITIPHLDGWDYVHDGKSELSIRKTFQAKDKSYYKVWITITSVGVKDLPKWKSTKKAKFSGLDIVLEYPTNSTTKNYFHFKFSAID